MSRRPVRAIRVLAAITLLYASACAGPARLSSVSVGAVLPAPWSGVTIDTAVPIGYGWW